MQNFEIFRALKPVVNALEKFSIPYYISGSVASSLYGISRATMDIDLIADIHFHHISLLKQELEELYYIDEDMIRDAIQRKSSFNLIHLETVIKIDVFIFNNLPYQQSVLERKVRDTLEGKNKKTEFYFLSPEDLIINKLQWYKLGNKISERQWLDIIGVIKIQRDSLDKNYLKFWSKKLGIFDLLKEAFEDAEIQL